jgi:FkbM family methyltransferase
MLNTIKRLFPQMAKKLIKEKLGVPSQESALKKLKALDYAPKTALDIGAYEGKWATTFRHIFNDCNILMIEGQTGKEKYLKALAEKYHNIDYNIVLLGSAVQPVKFNIYETASSVLEENNNTNAKVEERCLDTLDNLVKGSIYSAPDFIKIDTQGYELEILKGAENSISNASAVLLEVSLLDIYKNCPLVNDVMSFMAKHNFVLYDICSLMRRPLDGALYQSDFLFVRKDSPLRGDKRWIQ